MIFTEKKKPQNKKIKAYRRGIRAEIIAALYLTVTGWRVLAWRWKCPLGEIDLVAKRGKIISFIEVKARQNEQAAIDSITTHQWRRIQMLQIYLWRGIGTTLIAHGGLMRLLLFRENGRGDLKICGSTSI